MARPLRARYANVAVTFANTAVNKVSDTILFSSGHAFVNNALVVYTTVGTAMSPLVNSAPYYVTNTTPTTIQLTQSSGGLPLDIGSEGTGTHTLTRVVVDGVQEMTDAELQDCVIPVMINYWLTYPGSVPGTVLSVNNPSTNNISRGSATDTINISDSEVGVYNGYVGSFTSTPYFSGVPGTTVTYTADQLGVGSHPVSTAIKSEYTIYQSQTTAASIGQAGALRSVSMLTNPSIIRPVFYSQNGDRTEIKTMDNNDLNDHFWPAFFSAADLDSSGRGSYVVGTSSQIPATGTWSTAGVMQDYYASPSLTYDLYYLARRTDTYSYDSSLFHIRPLYYDANVRGLVEMTDSQLQTLSLYFYEFMMSTGIGQYSFGTSAPGVGTWVSRGQFVDKRNNTSATNYTGFFASNFTGAFTGIYTGAFTGQYGNAFTGAFTGPYAGSFTGAFSGSYSQQFTGAFSGNYSGSYVNSFTTQYSGSYSGTYNQAFTGAYAGGYTNAFTGLYASGFTGAYSGSYSRLFTGLYNSSFAGAYVGMYSATAYGGSYTGLYSLVIYYGGRLAGYAGYAGTYAGTFLSSPGSGTESYQITGTYAGTYAGTVYYSGRAASVNYVGLYSNPAYTGLGKPRAYAGSYANFFATTTIYYGGRPVTQITNYTGYFTGLFAAGAVGYGLDNYTPGTWGGTYTGTVYYNGTPAGVNYVGTYQAFFTGAKLDNRLFGVYAKFASSFTGAFTSTYSGSYAGTFTGLFVGAYGNTFTGVYSRVFTGSYSGSYTGAFTGSYTGLYSSSFSRFFSGAYTGAYSSAYTGAFTGAYNRSFTSLFTGAYSQAFSAGFTGVYAQSFTGIYNQAFTGAFSGVYTGLAVINTTSSNTTTLWIRTA
jgi:hypothetical protein